MVVTCKDDTQSFQKLKTPCQYFLVTKLCQLHDKTKRYKRNQYSRHLFHSTCTGHICFKYLISPILTSVVTSLSTGLFTCCHYSLQLGLIGNAQTQLQYKKKRVAFNLCLSAFKLCLKLFSYVFRRKFSLGEMKHGHVSSVNVLFDLLQCETMMDV